MTSWKTLHRSTVLDHSKWLRVENHTIELPDGTIIADWPWIISPDFINAFALTKDRRFLCFRQTKYAVSGTAIAPVGGYLEPGEDPMVAAKRELLEETGFAAPSWSHLGSFAVDGNHGAGTAHLYLATDAEKISEPVGGDLEEQELLFLSSDELRSVLEAGEVKVVSWAAAAALALLALER